MSIRKSTACVIALTYTYFTIGISRTSGLGYPIWLFLTGPNDRFRDFYVQLSGSPQIEVVQFEQFGEVVRGVFPLAIILYGHLGGFAAMTIEQGLMIYNLLSTAVLLAGVMATFSKWYVRLFVITSYPVLFSYFRGNNELLTFGIFLLGMTVIIRNQKTGVFIALLGQLIEPHLSILLWVRRLFNRQILWQVVTLSATAIALASLYVPRFSIFELIKSIVNFVVAQGVDSDLFRLTHNVSLTAGIKGYAHVIPGATGVLISTKWLALIGWAVALMSFALIVVVARKSKVEDVDLHIVVLSLSLLLPLYSFSYRTIWLLYPLGVLLESPSDKLVRSSRSTQILLMMLILVPKTWLVWSDRATNVEFYAATLVDPTLTLVLLFATLGKIRSKVGALSAHSLTKLPPSGVE